MSELSDEQLEDYCRRANDGGYITHRESLVIARELQHRRASALPAVGDMDAEHLRAWAGDIKAWGVRGLAETEYQIGHSSAVELSKLLLKVAAALAEPSGDVERMREATIEECAKVADVMAENRQRVSHVARHACVTTAARIRALSAAPSGDRKE